MNTRVTILLNFWWAFLHQELLYLFLDCGLVGFQTTISYKNLDKLEPLDDVTADRGFNIRDLVTKKAILNIPPLAKSKTHSSKACTKIRRIAAICIHVERAIERVKRFGILRDVFPLTLAADQSVFILYDLCWDPYYKRM